MQIQFTYDQPTSSLPSGMVEALDVAASYLDHLLANQITVNIEVGYGEITQYGQSSAVTYGAEGGSVDDALWSYAQTLQTYSAHITSADQQNAYSELAATSSTGGLIDVSSAQQKAFGQLAANSSALDGSVGFQVNGANGVAYGFNPLNRAVGNAWDFIGVALHEITHALGRVSQLGTGDDSLLDRFRYAATGQLQTNVTGSPAYFSLDGGVTHLANFDSTNQDPADWAPSVADDANLALSYIGVANDFGQVDLRELNALGFQRVAQTDDFEGKGTSDLIWRNATTGALWEWQFANGAFSGGDYLGTVSNFQIAGAGDFNGDGTTDLLWTNPTTGDAWTWLMSNGRVSGGYDLGNVSGWNATIGRFSGGGVSDILWQNASTGAIYLWKMQNGQFGSGAYLGLEAGWKVIGAGDFSANGTSDVLLENGGGEVWDWMMSNGAEVGAHDLGNVAGWSLIGTGDFNGDGATDLLWRNNASQDVVEWQMANGVFHAGVNLGEVSGANVVATGDYFGTGTSDIVWQNTTSGATTVWAMLNGQHMSAYDVALGNSAGFKGV
jgi:hypothetical protein